ncbi:hypothetical protein OV208_02045 [Corallococcus sp. bb12-1]|uniref:hypothetical protein n=1 Tax=Corallococcus sp. bb12-1 TaxID=2996784 RepID=UPI00226E82AA|nr:hypothetical protein [Corallococcus sp. bb12-1]MCY1040086.1 hypothetical protein [Corallococcus sp. bb12-1]
MGGTSLGRSLKWWSGMPWSGSPSSSRRPGARDARFRASRPGLAWMAGMVGALVAGGLVRRRSSMAASKAVLPGALLLAKAPAGTTTLAGQPPARPVDDGAWHPCADALALALGVSGDEAEGDPEVWPEPLVRRGPSGREHFWMEPGTPSRG